jgi:molybdate transport system ATP-binding protein
MSLVLRDVRLRLAHFTLDVSVEMRARSTALFGPSGAGKTSLLEVIAGVREGATGSMELNGREIGRLPARERRIGYVPQDDVLFPHLSVRDNVSYGARAEDGSVLDMLEIDHLVDRGVSQLSGGERKRVALARALASRPELLLLDEPLAGVDLPLRDRVLEYLLRVHDELSIPMIYVTHQMDEVRALCDEIVKIEEGRTTLASAPIHANHEG